MDNQQSEVVSLMEKRAREYPLLSRTAALRLETKDKEETLEELKSLHQLLQVLSQELREARAVVAQKEKQFTLLANYKNLLERTIVLPRLVTSTPKKKDKTTRLLEQLEAMTPAQLERLENIKL